MSLHYIMGQHGIFNEMIIMSGLFYNKSAEVDWYITSQQRLWGRHVSYHENIMLIPSQPVFVLYPRLHT